jgi:hypothetical protein
MTTQLVWGKYMDFGYHWLRLAPAWPSGCASAVGRALLTTGTVGSLGYNMTLRCVGSARKQLETLETSNIISKSLTSSLLLVCSMLPLGDV